MAVLTVTTHTITGRDILRMAGGPSTSKPIGRGILLNHIACCNAFGSGICNLDNANPTLCQHHKARTGFPNTHKIILTPTYSSLDEAAMAAANIILHCASENDYFEYSISIYGNEENTKFCLVETRLGTEHEVHSDYKIKYSGKYEYITSKYSFKADVHSHPIRSIHEFSGGDYILASGGETYHVDTSNSDYIKVNDLDAAFRPPHIKYLVGFHAWSGTRRYKKGAVVSYCGKFWIAKKHISLSTDYWGPYSGNSNWEEMQTYKIEPECKAKDGAVVFIQFYDCNRIEREYPFYEKKNGELDEYNGAREHFHPTLIKFTPPTLPGMDNEFDTEAAKRLAIAIHINNKSSSQEHEYRIITNFNTKIQQTDIVKELSTYVKWKNYFPKHF